MKNKVELESPNKKVQQHGACMLKGSMRWPEMVAGGGNREEEGRY